MSEKTDFITNYISSLDDADLIAGRSILQKTSAWETLHRNDWNLIVMLAGSGSARIGQTDTPMRPGSLYLFAPSENPRQLVTGSWKTYWAHFRLLSTPSWPEEHPGVYVLTPPRFEFRRALRDLMEVLTLAVNRRNNWRPLAANLLNGIILRGNMLSTSPLTDRRMQKSENMLNDPLHYTDIDQIAAECGMSRSVFYNRFREIYAITPRVFRERAQMNTIRILLESTSLSLPEIAQRAGMSDLPHFFKRFKRYYGMTPTQYRQRNSDSPKSSHR